MPPVATSINCSIYTLYFVYSSNYSYVRPKGGTCSSFSFTKTNKMLTTIKMIAVGSLDQLFQKAKHITIPLIASWIN